ncbi:mitochondrial inner-membrane-bound regulator-domain-containing protein [Biscogniauxia marginata]|nr:mitochondrial inner-membrane-bound regulator-domain-containing protein [Biscogniauxia marginata]
MISRGISSGNVCLSCRLRLLGQHSRSLRPVNRIFGRRSASSLSEPEPAQDGDGQPDNDGARESHDFKGGNSVKRPEFRKRRFSRNRLLTESSASLGLDMLGKPGYAIVMKDGGIVKRQGQSDDTGNLEIEPDHEVADIEAVLQSKGETPSKKEIHAYIDSLRPQTETTLPEKEFRRLQGLLVDGFLRHQLDDYYIKHSKKDEGHSDDHTLEADSIETDSESAQGSTVGEGLDTPVEEELDTPIRGRIWIKSISPWVPLKYDFSTTEETDPNLQGYIPDGASPKEKVAVRILRECWGLSIAEFVMGLGETRVKLRNHEFILLMRGTQRFVNSLSQVWLDPGEKIEAFRNQRALRLVTTKTKAEVVLKKLHQTLKLINEKTFPLVLTGLDSIDEAVLEEVGRITNTHVRLSPSNRRVYVTWIEIKSRAGKGFNELEDLRHVVFRLLLTAFRNRSVTSTLYAADPGIQSQGRLITDATSQEKLSWGEKMSKWARYVLPVTHKNDVPMLDAPLKKLELPFEPESTFTPEDAFVLDDIKEFYPDSAAPFHPVKWSSGLRTSTAARFGYLLHPHEVSGPAPNPGLSHLLASNGRHVFAPITPHPHHFSRIEKKNTESIKSETPAKTTIIFRFWPSPATVPANKPPKMNSKDKKRLSTETRRQLKKQEKEIEAEPDEVFEEPPAPVLELRLSATDTEILGVESLRAIKRAHNSDVLLPSSPVDLRFTQMEYATLLAKDAATLAAWQPIQDYVNAARLDLVAGKLEARPTQRFHVPRRLYSNWLDGDIRPYLQSELDPDELISAQYTFVGLEVHRSISLPYDGHRLTYTSIEAGRGGGRRAEVILEPVPREEGGEQGQVGQLANDQLEKDFLACCFKFATANPLWSSSVTEKGAMN